MNAPKAVIYCRVSTKEQAKKMSLPHQEDACRKYCDTNGYNVIKVFKDKGQSAKDDNREAFQEMLKYCAANKATIDYVIVNDVDRFSRNSLIHAKVREALSLWGIQLRSVCQIIDESSEGKMLEGIFSVLAEYDNNKRADRTVAGMKKALQSGKWVHEVPIGYLRDSKDGNRIIIDSKTAPLIRRLFQLFATGKYTKRDCLRRVQRLGLKTKTGAEVSFQMLDRILVNEFYIGWMVIEKWNIREQGQHKPIIKQDLFEKVQSLLRGKNTNGIRHERLNPDFPLRHFTKCNICNTPVTASWSTSRSGRKYAYYFCKHKACKVRVEREVMHRFFTSYLESLQPSDGYFNLFNHVVRDVWKSKQSDFLSHKQALESRVQFLKKREEKLREKYLYGKGEIEAEIFQEENAKLKEQILAIEIQIHESAEDELNIEAALKLASNLLKNVSKLWRQATLEQRLQLQKVLFPDGILLDAQGIRTGTLSNIFEWIQPKLLKKTNLASPRGFEPLLPP